MSDQRTSPTIPATVGWLKEALADIPDDYFVKTEGDYMDYPVSQITIDDKDKGVLL